LRHIQREFAGVSGATETIMGGLGSTRWNWLVTKNTTDSLLRLDVRELARSGALAPGNQSISQWTRDGRPAGSVGLQAEAQALVLVYAAKGLQDLDWTPIRERIDLATTPCQYGGERPWFVCPSCQQRRAVLYLVGDRFRCRCCHDLVYSSTRVTPGARAQRRADAVRAQLGDGSGRRIPGLVDLPKPKGMHWRTYRRLRAELIAQELAALSETETNTDKLIARLRKRLEPA
jgi:hypothetical protein